MTNILQCKLGLCHSFLFLFTIHSICIMLVLDHPTSFLTFWKSFSSLNETINNFPQLQRLFVDLLPSFSFGVLFHRLVNTLNLGTPSLKVSLKDFFLPRGIGSCILNWMKNPFLSLKRLKCIRRNVSKTPYTLFETIRCSIN